jgi:hypothetical protein
VANAAPGRLLGVALRHGRSTDRPGAGRAPPCWAADARRCRRRCPLAALPSGSGRLVPAIPHRSARRSGHHGLGVGGDASLRAAGQRRRHRRGEVVYRRARRNGRRRRRLRARGSGGGLPGTGRAAAGVAAALPADASRADRTGRRIHGAALSLRDPHGERRAHPDRAPAAGRLGRGRCSARLGRASVRGAHADAAGHVPEPRRQLERQHGADCIDPPRPVCGGPLHRPSDGGAHGEVARVPVRARRRRPSPRCVRQSRVVHRRERASVADRRWRSERRPAGPRTRVADQSAVSYRAARGRQPQPGGAAHRRLGFPTRQRDDGRQR